MMGKAFDHQKNCRKILYLDPLARTRFRIIHKGHVVMPTYCSKHMSGINTKL